MQSLGEEQVGLESFAEAGERLWGADIGKELVSPLWCQNTEEL